MKKRYRSKIAQAVHEDVSGLYEIGLIDPAAMRKFDKSCLTTVADFCPDQVKTLREREQVSQAVLAEHLDVSVATVSQWERGVRTPEGPARKLLGLALSRGLAYIQ